jgi:hypothetical protein
MKLCMNVMRPVAAAPFCVILLHTINTNTAVMRTSEVQTVVTHSVKVSEMLFARMALHLKISIFYKVVFH